MPELMTAILFEKNERALVVRRRVPPFAGQYVLPIVRVGAQEAAEEAMRRHARDQFGLTLEPDTETFIETVYLAEGEAQYVANIFRAQLPDGPMRFNAEGDYDNARWCAAADLEAIAMPPDLRIPLAKVLTDPDALHELDWDTMGKELTTQAVPLAERAAAVGAQPVAPASDNKASWDAIAKAYQEEIFGDRFGTALMWSWSLSEDDLRLLDDVRGKHALVLGCGGGQDVVALSMMGALAVGIDFSPKQLEYARKYALKHSADNASFAEANIEDLSQFDDESFDLAVAIHSLGHVERAGVAIAEAGRVLKPGGVLAFSVQHPFHHMHDSAAPYGLIRPYWTSTIDWRWQFENGAAADFRAYPHTLQEWFDMLAGAGFAVERIVEPKQTRITGDDAKQLDVRLAQLAPYALIMKARRR